MNKKIERELHGPSWTEVILGAVLSLLLGVVLAATYLILKPVTVARELPKDAVAGAVYYIEGSRDSSKARQAGAKQKAFVEGGSIVLNEDELNLLAAPSAAPATAKPDAAGEVAGATAGATTITPGALNFRIRESRLQIGMPLQVSVLGLQKRVIVQARGGFEKRGSTFGFAPEEFYVGSCPLQRLPVVGGVVMKQIMARAAMPTELAEAWTKLSDVAIEGSTLRLTME